jgi:hypothetical protein
MLIQTDEKSVTLTPFGSLALNGAVNATRGGGRSWIEMIHAALLQADQIRVSFHAWMLRLRGS